MQREALLLLGDNDTLAAHVTASIPSEFSGGKPSIQNLFDSLEYKGVYFKFPQHVCSAIVTRGRSPNWSQAWFYKVYSGSECTDNIQLEVGSKILRTFEPDIAYNIFCRANCTKF